MFSKGNFQSWGKKEVVLFASIMTRIAGHKDDDLLTTYGFQGFPSMALLDADGEKVTDRIGYDLYSMRTVADAALSYRRLKPKVDAGEKVDEGAWFLARLGMDKLELDEAKEECAGLELTDAQRKSADTQLFIRELTKVLRARAPAETTADKVYGFYKAGKSVPEDSLMVPAWEELVLRGADKAGDAKAFHAYYAKVKADLESKVEKAKAGLRQYRGNKRAEQYFNGKIEEFDAQLKRFAARAADLKQ